MKLQEALSEADAQRARADRLQAELDDERAYNQKLQDQLDAFERDLAAASS